MKIRSIIPALLCLALSYQSRAQRIDRYALVNRHNVEIGKIEPLAPLSVGNGDFAFTADITGMQSFEDHYWKNGISLETLSTWCWHSFPNADRLKLQDAMKEIDFHGRKIMYASQEKTPAGEYFRQNPHPVPLGQIGLVQGNGKPLDTMSIGNVHQKLDLWRGIINSNYTVNGTSVSVETISHPELSEVAFKIKSALLKGGLKTSFRFPYSYDFKIKNKPPFDWSKPERHQTTIISQTANSVVLKRNIEGTVYYVSVNWQGKAKFSKDGEHRFLLESMGADSLQLVCSFSKALNKEAAKPTFASIKTLSTASWKNFWTKGGAVDLSGSKDPRANELERRMVLSQYLLHVNYAGSFPPQETGLTTISWYGKHNSEVYWWHAAQFYEWGHTESLEKSFAWYKKILPTAVAQAKSEGFEGARWPKMSGIDGRPSPGSINPFIIWNQCNPIYLAELIYRAHPDKATLNKYGDVVFESAKFLSSYAFWDEKTDRYILGPPIKGVAEHNAENETQNPTFELTQWYYGLKVAQDWRERLGMPRDKHWDDILAKLSRPAIHNGRYAELETEPGNGGSDQIMALGYLPKTPMIDEKVMAETFNSIYDKGGLRGFISWSLGKGALTAARLNEPDKAVNILANDRFGALFLKNGHVQRAKEPLACPAYLPANSAFMAAAGLMAAGWDGAPNVNAPGFPQDGNWVVRVEGLNKLP